MGAVAQFDKSQIVLKLHGTWMRKRAKEGRCEGRKPYGFYDGEASAIEAHEDVAGGLGFAASRRNSTQRGLKRELGYVGMDWS